MNVRKENTIVANSQIVQTHLVHTSASVKVVIKETEGNANVRVVSLHWIVSNCSLKFVRL